MIGPRMGNPAKKCCDDCSKSHLNASSNSIHGVARLLIPGHPMPTCAGSSKQRPSREFIQHTSYSFVRFEDLQKCPAFPPKYFGEGVTSLL